MNGNMNGNSWYTATINSTHFTYRKYSELSSTPLASRGLPVFRYQ